MSLLYLSLEGAVLNEKHGRLLELLLGHCSSVQSPFRMREANYTLEVKDSHTREIKARCYLDAGGEPVWTLRQSDKQVYSTHSTEVRNLKEVKVSDDIETFMEILGAKFQYEYLKVGLRTVVRLEKCKADIIICKIKRLQERGNINSGVDIDSTRYHVELGAAALEKDIQAVSQELTSFASQLFPIVELRKM